MDHENGTKESAILDDWYEDAGRKYTVDQMLDVPFWSYELENATFDKLIDFEQFVIKCEDILQHELVAHNYNTFNSFINFYHDYKNIKKKENNISLVDFIANYKTEVSVESLSCVGLALSLIVKLRRANPKHTSCIGLVSCEEVVKDTGSYCMESPNNVKEHVMVAIRFTIEKDRQGFILLDPGYHVARPIIVMNDMAYPHTGWFTYSSNPNVVKEYCYQVIDDRFIAWKVKETRNDFKDEWCNLIYAKQAFTKCLSITEKRSLVFSLKSLVIRDRKGPVAGLYCWMENKHFTVFYNSNGKKVQEKVAFDHLGSSQADQLLFRLAGFMENRSGIDVTVKSLQKMMRAFKVALTDDEFMSQLNVIDKWIES